MTSARKKIIVGIIYGGKSPEHEVSIVSAKGVIENINREKFSAVKIFIDKKGQFWLDNKNRKRFDPFVDASKIDVFFPVLHGYGGEDGEIQGLLCSINKPFVGADILASGICLDKGIFKLILKAEGLPQTRFAVLDFTKTAKASMRIAIIEIKLKFRFPVFVKPCNLGSSVGIFKVKNKNRLAGFIDQAKKFDSRIVIEESVEKCREIEISVLGNNYKNTKVSLPGEIVSGAEFYDYDDKYNNCKAKTVAPAELGARQIKQIQQLAMRAYNLVCCEGLARVDFLINQKGKIYINEINTIPGFTPISMYPKMWEASGLDYKRLITTLILLALKKNLK